MMKGLIKLTSIRPSIASPRVALACAVVAWLFSGAGWADCSPTNAGMARMESARIVLLGEGRRIAQVALIADDDNERASGYQHICPAVVARTAMLFRYPKAIAGQFHMRNVYAALDIGFFDARGILIQVLEMQPYAAGEDTLYGPMQKFQYALEARRGFFAEKGLAAGVARLALDTLP